MGSEKVGTGTRCHRFQKRNPRTRHQHQRLGDGVDMNARPRGLWVVRTRDWHPGSRDSEAKVPMEPSRLCRRGEYKCRAVTVSHAHTGTGIQSRQPLTKHLQDYRSAQHTEILNSFLAHISRRNPFGSRNRTPPQPPLHIPAENTWAALSLSFAGQANTA